MRNCNENVKMLRRAKIGEPLPKTRKVSLAFEQDVW